METRRRRRSTVGESKWIRFYEDWLPILIGLTAVALIFGFAIRTREWKRVNKPTEAHQTYIVERFDDLIYPRSTKLERWMMEPWHGYWRFQYRPAQHERFIGDFGRVLLSQHYKVQPGLANELRVDLDLNGPSKRVAIVRLSRTDGPVTVHVAEIPDFQNTADYWTRVNVSVSHRSQEGQ